MDAPHDADRAHAKLAESASTLKDSAVQQADSADRRTELAADRTILAGERTYAAWVRTGLAALASGIGARALLKDVVFPWLATATGTMLILFSAFCFLQERRADLRDLWPSPIPSLPCCFALGIDKTFARARGKRRSHHSQRLYLIIPWYVSEHQNGAAI